MLVIRFLRVGKKHQPFYRIVVTDKKNPPKGGRFLEIVGFFNPLTKEKQLKTARIKYWLGVGAQPSDRVHNMLISDKIIEGKKVAVHAKKKIKDGDEEKPVEAPKEEKVEEKPKEKKEDKPADIEAEKK